jgi:hypothetical protein
MNLYGRPLPASRQLHPRGTKLFDYVQSFGKRFIVDNNIPWERYARDHRNRDIAFILGTTVLNERPQLLSLYEDLANGNRKVFRNVFHFGAEELEMTERGHILRGHLVLDNLYNTFQSLTDRDKLQTIGNFCSPQGLQKPKEESDSERARLDALIMEGANALSERIHREVPKSFRDYRKCIELARWCLALLLVKDPEARRRFLKQGSVNSFCDAALVKDALFWNAGILSGDAGARKMARFCKLTAVRELSV